MPTTNGKTALITGASSGIGYELSRLFAADGYDLVLIARSGQKLNELATELCKTGKINVTVLAKDLGDPAAPDEIFKILQAQSIMIDVLINNAGFGAHGPFAQNDWAEELGMLHVNVIALTHLTKLFLPGMVKHGSGKIMNVGSTGSFAPGPSMAVYCATKAYVLSFSEALAAELNGTGVTVTALCPGVTRTGFQARANVEKIRMLKDAGMSAKQVAEIGYRAMQRGTPVVIPGVWNWLMIFSTRFIPRSLVTGFSRRMMETVGD
jgi:short-subunit dehydrogenase